jgi:phosphotransferase system enzyme I (PtsI)
VSDELSAGGGGGDDGGRRILQGVAASPGIAVGRAFVIDRRKIKTPKRHIEADEVEGEIARFEAALETSAEQLSRLSKKLAEKEGDEHFLILEAHQLILRDEHLVLPTKRRIREEHINAEWALRKTVDEIKAVFDTVEADYFRERRSDVDFVGERILRNLVGVDFEARELPPEGAIIVAHDLSPADTASLHRQACGAFVTDVGGKTSHSAILARAFDIPSVVGLETVTEHVGNGDLLIVDGIQGRVFVRPTPAEVEEYRSKGRAHVAFVRELRQNRDLPAETQDGARVRLYANVEIVEEVPAALEHGAEGIGLYRTEFLFLDRPDLPKEEEHFMHARGVLRRLHPYPATFRTFDLGGDKQAPAVTQLLGAAGAIEENPALGLRSIRLCLRERKLFKAQLRGLLRASVHGRMRLMFPMISGVGELREAKAMVDEAKAELDREGHPYDTKLPIGIMVEMPSAVMVADLLAREADFMSIGTNDLIQYSLAIDRVNEHVGYLYHPLHPAILRMIRNVVDAAHAAGIRVGLCGEMAGEPLYSLILVGLGIDEMSMNSTSIPIVKSVLRGTKLAAARELAEQALSLATSTEIEQLVQEYMQTRYPEELLRAAGEAIV